MFFFYRLAFGISTAFLIHYTPYFVSGDDNKGSIYFFLIFEFHRISRMVRTYIYIDMWTTCMNIYYNIYNSIHKCKCYIFIKLVYQYVVSTFRPTWYKLELRIFVVFVLFSTPQSCFTPLKWYNCFKFFYILCIVYYTKYKYSCQTKKNK